MPPNNSSCPSVNPAWENAPYEVVFMVGICLPAAVRRWTKWRRIKWRRQKLRRYGGRWFPGAIPDPRLDAVRFHPESFRGEVTNVCQ